jgi:gas vesicle protein
MTASTDTFVDSFVENAQRTREAVAGAVTEAVRSWAGAVAGLASGRPSVPDAHVVVDRWFDIAQTVLDTQKAFAKSGVGGHAAEVYTEQAQKAAQTVAGAVRERVAEVSEAGQVADRQATSAVRAMRDSAQKN